MPLPLLSNSYALLIAGLLAISSSVGQSENRDPHFTPTAAKSTSYMPRVIIRNRGLRGVSLGFWFLARRNRTIGERARRLHLPEDFLLGPEQAGDRCSLLPV